MITVKQIMELDLIRQDLTLIGGQEGLEKEVNFITIMEAPDFYEWVSGNEFVLTSWYSYSQNPENQDHAFRELAKRVSAIAIKTNRFLDQVPPQFIAIANECKTPLFSLKRETKFREVIQTVAGEVQNAQANILREVEQNYQELLQKALATDNLSALLQIIGRYTGLSCFCLKPDGQLMAHWVAPASTLRVLKSQIKHFQEIYHLSEPNLAEYATQGFYIFPCTARKQLLGSLILVSDNDLTERSHLIANQTTAIISLKLLEGYETRQKQLLKLLADIYENRLVEDQLRSLGLDLRKEFFSISILVGDKNKGNPYIDLAYQQIHSCPGNHLAMLNHNELVMIDTLETKEQAIPPFLSLLKDWLAKKEYPLVLVQGTIVSDVKQLRSSLDLAKKAARAALHMKAQGWHKQSDWLSYSLILSQLHAPETLEIIKQIITPIQQYDLSHKLDLLHTLKVFMTEEKLEGAAKKLHLHVNTLRYRMKKIYDITKYNPQNPKDMIILGMALIIWDLQQK